MAGKGGYASYRIPALAKADYGNIIIAFAEGRVENNHDYGNIDVVYRISYNNGRSWVPNPVNPPYVLCDKNEHTCGNPTALVDQETKKIWVMMNVQDGNTKQKIVDLYPKDGKDDNDGRFKVGKGDRRTFVSFSNNHGKTFSNPKEITKTVERDPLDIWDAVGPGLGIQITKGEHVGRLVFPALNRNIYSDDHGETWLAQPLTHGGTSEATIVELNDGALMRNDRAVSKKLKCVFKRPVSISEDGGLNWSVWSQKNNLKAPGHSNNYDESLGTECPNEARGIGRCHASMMRYSMVNPFNRIVFTNPASTSERKYMTIRISYDEGESWPISQVLYKNATAYSALVKTADKMIGVLYAKKDIDPQGKEKKNTTLKFHKINLSHILNGKQEPIHIGGNSWLGTYSKFYKNWFWRTGVGWVYSNVSTRIKGTASLYFQDQSAWFYVFKGRRCEAYNPNIGWVKLCKLEKSSAMPALSTKLVVLVSTI